MKFCKKCHRRTVTKIDSSVNCSLDSVKICMCNGIALMHRSVINRFGSEVGDKNSKRCVREIGARPAEE